MDVLGLPGSDLESDSEMIASLLAVGHEFATDRYWNDTATALISGLIAHIGSTAKPSERNLTTLRSYLYNDDLDYLLATLLDNKAVVSPLARDEFVSYLAAPSDKTRPCIRSTATTYVKALGSSRVAATLESSSFDLADVVAGKPMTIYLVIPPEKLESHKTLLRLWISTLLTAVTSRREIPRLRTLFILDECAQLGSLPALRQSITLLRGYGLQVWAFFQDLSQLRLLYPQDWQTMVNNCGVLQSFGFNNQLMARDWTDLLGVDADELMRLPAEDAMMCLAPGGPRRCRRLDYLRDEAFAGLFDPNPRYALVAPPGAERAA